MDEQLFHSPGSTGGELSHELFMSSVLLSGGLLPEYVGGEGGGDGGVGEEGASSSSLPPPSCGGGKQMTSGNRIVNVVTGEEEEVLFGVEGEGEGELLSSRAVQLVEELINPEASGTASQLLHVLDLILLQEGQLPSTPAFVSSRESLFQGVFGGGDSGRVRKGEEEEGEEREEKEVLRLCC